MADIEIIRKQTIIVDEVRQNNYGDLTFTDKDGNEYKVGIKRRQYFENIIIPDATVRLNYSKFKGKEYIYNADVVKDGEKPSPKPASTTDTKDTNFSKIEHKSSPETGMWWGQMGEMLRCGDIDKSTTQGKALRNTYYAEMCRVLGINIKEVESGEYLKKEAKRLGATEIKEDE